MHHHIYLVTFLTIFTLSTWGCSSENDTEPPSTSGTEQSQPWVWDSSSVGRVEIADSARAEALDIKAELSESPQQSEEYTFVSPILKLTPHGTAFDEPVHITLFYNDDGTPGELVVLRLADDTQATWEPIEATLSAGTAKIETLAFSYYGVARRNQKCDDTNACGGCEELEHQPDETCGPCAQGTYACDGENAVVCNEAQETNACGGCEALEHEPNEVCGPCEQGAYICDSENAVVCDGARETNACGGCEALDHQPDEACGPCGQGTYACNGENAVACDGARETNACGGCDDLDHQPDEACGPCGQGTYICNGTNAIACNEATELNACGGCEELENVPGEPCACNGTWVCEGIELACSGNREDFCICDPTDLGNSYGRFLFDELIEGDEESLVWEAPYSGYHRIILFTDDLPSPAVVRRASCDGDIIANSQLLWQLNGCEPTSADTVIDTTVFRFHAQEGERFIIELHNIDRFRDRWYTNIDIDKSVHLHPSDGFLQVNGSISTENGAHSVGDINGDGKIDFLEYDFRDEMPGREPYQGRIHYGQDAAAGDLIGSAPNVVFNHQGNPPHILPVGDRTGDQIDDFAIFIWDDPAQSQYHLISTPPEGVIDLSNAVATSSAVGYNVGDLDGDRNDDMVVFEETISGAGFGAGTLTLTGNVGVVYGPLTANTNPAQSQPLLTGLGSQTESIRYATDRTQPWISGIDWGGSRRVDLITNLSNGVYLFSDLSSPTQPLSPEDATWSLPAIDADISAGGDLNNDNIQDLIVVVAETSYIFFGPLVGREGGLDSADITFDSPARGVGDLNGDGFDELVLQNLNIGGPALNGHSYFFSIVLGPITTNSIEPATVVGPFHVCNPGMIFPLLTEDKILPFTDVDGDGIDDLVLYGGSIFVYRGGSTFPGH